MLLFSDLSVQLYRNMTDKYQPFICGHQLQAIFQLLKQQDPTRVTSVFSGILYK